MKSVITFSVKGFPQTKGSTRAFIPKGWNRAVITNDNKKNKPWEKVVKMMAQCQAPKDGPWCDPIELNMRFFLKKPKSHPKTKHVWHTKKPDVDKLIRSIKDSLSGIIYMDDRQVVSVHAFKQYGDAPGVDIEITNLVKMKGEGEKN